MTIVDEYAQSREAVQKAVKAAGLFGWWVRLSFVYCSPFQLIGFLKYADRFVLRIRYHTYDLWKLKGTI